MLFVFAPLLNTYQSKFGNNECPLTYFGHKGTIFVPEAECLCAFRFVYKQFSNPGS